MHERMNRRRALNFSGVDADVFQLMRGKFRQVRQQALVAPPTADCDEQTIQQHETPQKNLGEPLHLCAEFEHTAELIGSYALKSCVVPVSRSPAASSAPAIRLNLRRQRPLVWRVFSTPAG